LTLVVQPPSRIRAFVALDLPDTLRRALGDVIARLRPDVRDIRWTRVESLHVTLRFLGWSDPAALDLVRPALRAAAAATSPLEVRIGALGTFPERGRARVLWAGLELPPEAFRLQAACEDAARAARFPREERPFAPHLTLGRWKRPGDAGGMRPPRTPQPGARSADSFVLDRLVLFRSEPRAKGSVYTPIEGYTLGER
jgi:RNA 2',3'-cyclic 3'-phosphodiesterase